jgi:signal peptidase I
VNRGSLGCLLEILETLLVTVLVFVVIQMFVAQPYEVQQESMENTLLPNQYVLVDKLTPRFAPYHQGDVIVFSPPTGWSRDASNTPYVKRVIGVAGDIVAIHDGKVFVNGSTLDEPYIFGGQATLVASGAAKTWTLGPGQLFVMGDHRQASQDSRVFGPIDTSTVIGRVWIRYWPFSSFGPLPNAAPSPSPGAPSPSPSGA